MARKFIPVPFGTMAKAGDIPHLPRDVSEELVNVLHRPGPRIDKRAAWGSDMTGNVPLLGASPGGGYLKWRDRTNNVDRLAVVSDTPSLHVKDLLPAETWGAGIAGATAGVKDFANYKGLLYWLANAVAGAPKPYSYDGTTIDIDPFRERLSGESIVAWKDRLWMFNVYQTITNLMYDAGLPGRAYGIDWDSYSAITEEEITTNGATITTWTPTTTTWGGSTPAKAILEPLPASTENTDLVLRASFQGQAALYRMPMTLQIIIWSPILRNTAVLQGTIRQATNGFRYRALTSGTTAGVAPAFDLTPGTETVDGTVTWHNEGSEAIGSQEIEVPNATESNGKFSTFVVKAQLPPMPEGVFIAVAAMFGTEARPTYEQHPVVVGFRDGKTDGDPSKQNYGWQVTTGRFIYDFVNTENTATAVKHYPNRIICSEAGIPTDWRAELYWEMVDGQDRGVVIRPLKEMLCAYKRNAVSVYRIVEGPASARLPVRYVATHQGVGCIHPRAIDTFEGRHYFIGEHGVYVFGGGEAPPEEITGEAMREAVFARSGEWFENVGLAPILRVDETNRELRIYTQSPRIWVMSLDSRKWTSINVTKSGGTSAVVDMTYHRNRFYALAVDNKLVREDTAATQDAVYGGAAQDVTAEVWLHPFETIPRNDMLVEEVELHGEITGDQTGSVLEVAISQDRGATFTLQHTITIPLPSDFQPIRIPIWQSGANLTVRLRHVGKAGTAYFNLFWAGVWVQDLGAELSDVSPTTVSSTL